MVLDAVGTLDFQVGEDLKSKITVTYPDPKLGDYATNAALVLAKALGKSPNDVAKEILAKMEISEFESITVAGAGFINFRLKTERLLDQITDSNEPAFAETSAGEQTTRSEKILVEYFQPNVAKPLHIGHLRTAIIGDCLSRMLKFLGHHVESDTHMGDWGTQFGQLILAYRKYGNPELVANDPINELNKLYVKINQEIEKNPVLYDEAKQEFVKLERGDPENLAIWKKFVDWSMAKHLQINELMGIQKFDHHWPESFYQDKMPAVLMELKIKGLLKESQGAQIVDLENQGLGVALIVKSDGGTTYLLRDLATFIYRKSLGFQKQLYVVDVRQARVFAQLFAILKLIGEIKDGEAIHIDYGFMSFKGEALSTRSGNMVLAEELIKTANEKVSKIIASKNPSLKDKAHIAKVIAQGAIKYFDLAHNRHSDIEFDWDKALDFNGDSGPYLQYTYARLSSILRKAEVPSSKFQVPSSMTPTEREVLFKSTILAEIVSDTAKEYMPNILANYLFSFATLLNKFYHESPVLAEKDQAIKNFRLSLIAQAAKILGQGMDLLGIEPVAEM